MGTPAADRPEIASPNHANSLLLEKFAPSPGGFGRSGKTPQGTTQPQQFVLQTSKANSVGFLPLDSAKGLLICSLSAGGFVAI